MGEQRIVGPVEVDGGKGTVELRAGGIIHLIWNAGLRLEVQDARAAVNRVAGY